MNALKLLRSLAESTSPADALEWALGRLLKDKEVKDGPNGSRITDWKIGGMTVIRLSRNEKFGWVYLYVLSSEGSPTKDSFWDCDHEMEIYPAKRDRVCRAEVNEKTYRALLKAVPQIVKKATASLRAKRGDLLAKEAIIGKTYKAVRGYLEKVAKELGKKIEGDHQGLTAEVWLVSEGRKENGKISWFIVRIGSSAVYLTFTTGLSRKESLYFDINPFKRGARKIRNRFPAIKRVTYRDDKATGHKPEVIIEWEDPSKMPEDLVEILKMVRK